jgi:hypothetical protein
MSMIDRRPSSGSGVRLTSTPPREIRIALLEVDVAPSGNYWSGRTTH